MALDDRMQTLQPPSGKRPGGWGRGNRLKLLKGGWYRNEQERLKPDNKNKKPNSVKFFTTKEREVGGSREL